MVTGGTGDGQDDAAIEAGRARYDSALWRRVYDSFAWTWVIGSLVFVSGAVAYSVVVSGDRVEEGLVFGGVMWLFVAGAQLWRRRRRT